MKRVTLHWDVSSFGLFYYNGEKWRYKQYGMNWRDSFHQDWNASDFDKSLTVNNIIEK